MKQSSTPPLASCQCDWYDLHVRSCYRIACAANFPSLDGQKIAYPQENKTERKIHHPRALMTASGLDQANEEAIILINDLDIFLCGKLV